MSIKQKSKSLTSKGSPLADTFYQLDVLQHADVPVGLFPPFAERIGASLQPTLPTVFQVNIGKLCNQSCAHCHVDAGPDRKHELMNRANLEVCLRILETHDIPVVDITGGAPEMHPDYRWFVESCVALRKKVMTRCNLTIIMAHPKYGDLPDFFAQNKVQVVSSLPYFSKGRTDSQRGEGVFEDSITALHKLNAVGYGKPGSGLLLDLVYNPSGAFLPGSQASLEREFKSQLGRKYGIEFNQLYVITNLPISRFLDYLLESGNYAEYMSALSEAFNSATLDGLMCRYTLSVSWEGYMYDCDFNQMLDLKVASGAQHIADFDLNALMQRQIVVNQHCYGCTAGAGSSCGGEIA